MIYTNRFMRTYLTLQLLILVGISGNVLGDGDPLANSFRNPPATARPHTWWHWMNGNISREGITADLEAMKQIGLSGATIVNVDSGIPRGNVPFMSSEWRTAFKFAVQEAHRLGLELCVENCAGWSSSGGPWNTVTNAMQRVTTSEMRVSGPTNFSGRLAQPQTTLGFYRDIAVLAFPAPATETVRMKDFSPRVSSSSGEAIGDQLSDGDAGTALRIPISERNQPRYVELQFKNPFLARSVKIVCPPGQPEFSGEIQASEDGKAFRTIKPFAFGRRSAATRVFSFGMNFTTARFWRLQFNAATNQIPLAEIELSPNAIIESIEAKSGDIDTAILSAAYAGKATAAAISRRDIVDLSAKVEASGQLDWQVPPGDWVILRIGHTPTGRLNKPPPKEGEGLECDKLSKAALDVHWAGFMQKILDDVGPLAGAGKTLNNALIDSYEVGGQNWTANFREEFKQRRGYDLLQFFPTFTGRVVENSEVSERFLWDMRKTIADLFAENYFGHFATLCRERGLLTSIEPYTGPFESLQCGAPADVVMGEFWCGRPVHRSVKIASSAAHIYGKTIVGAESFTAYPEPGSWRNDPYALKALGDQMFCLGINRYIFHRYAHQPWTNRAPGMTMGQWGFHFERTVTWWDEGKPWIDYITRCQFLLQQGRPVADVANFCGESVPVEIRAGDPATPAGYDFDAINADVLLHRTTVKNGRITLPDGLSYAALVLPPEDVNMTPPVLERIGELVRAGATVVGPRPQHSPSLADFPKCDTQVQRLAAELWGKCDGSNITENVTGQGRIVWGKSLIEVFAAQKLKPDFEFIADSSDTKLAYVHRVAGNADIYFVSNQRTDLDAVECTFRVSGKTPELWHADTGVVERAPVWRGQDGRTIVHLTFEPSGAVFVIFREPVAGDHVVSAKADPQWQTVSGSNGELFVKATTDGVAEFETAAGKTLKAVAANVPAPLKVTGGWSLIFPPNWGAPPSATLDKLISWTEHANEGIRYFSGTATYEKEIEIPAARLGANRELWLDLGVVKNLAEVSLNGQNLGVLWKPPFRVDLTRAAKPGENKLVVKVTNLWPNRLIGDEQLPADAEWNGKKLRGWPDWLQAGKRSPTGRLTFATWHHWTKDDALLESGLLGPVKLETAVTVAAE